MNICVISPGYPDDNGFQYRFVEQLCIELAKKKNNITVIAPQSITKNIIRKRKKTPYKRVFTYRNTTITVLSPKYISLSNIGDKIPIIKNGFRNAVLRALKSLEKPDILYGHFWHSAFACYRYAKNYHIPLFVASGESVITWTAKTKEKKDFINYINGVICVSTKNKNESIEKLAIKEKKCEVIPNGFDPDIFHKMEKLELREKLGLKKDSFIVIFVGSFIYRKGPDRVVSAIKKLDNLNINSIFIGSSPDKSKFDPIDDGILFKGRLSHERLAEYLNVADIFILPTLKEGCCNAIVEAMACGLPIISSDLEFNYDLLDCNNALLVDPLNVDQLAESIKFLYHDDTKRNKMGFNSLKKADNLSLSKRADKILEYIKINLNKS